MFNLKLQKNKEKGKSAYNSQNPKILEVDLIRGEMPVSFDLKRHAGTLILAILIAAIFVAEIYYGLNWWSEYENKRLDKSQQRFMAISEEIKQMNDQSKQINDFKERVGLADSLLSNHIYWTNFFNWLESNTLSSVNYQGFSGSIDGEYELEAMTKAFRDISWQSRVFLADPQVIAVSIDSASDSGGPEEEADDGDNNDQDLGDISFSVSLKVTPEIFEVDSLNK